MWNSVSVLCSYCQLVEVHEVSGGREGLVELHWIVYSKVVLYTYKSPTNQ